MQRTVQSPLHSQYVFRSVISCSISVCSSAVAAAAYPRFNPSPRNAWVFTNAPFPFASGGPPTRFLGVPGPVLLVAPPSVVPQVPKTPFPAPLPAFPTLQGPPFAAAVPYFGAVHAFKLQQCVSFSVYPPRYPGAMQSSDLSMAPLFSASSPPAQYPTVPMLQAQLFTALMHPTPARPFYLLEASSSDKTCVHVPWSNSTFQALLETNTTVYHQAVH